MTAQCAYCGSAVSLVMRRGAAAAPERIESALLLVFGWATILTLFWTGIGLLVGVWFLVEARRLARAWRPYWHCDLCRVDTPTDAWDRIRVLPC